jgi:hypothetical protein
MEQDDKKHTHIHKPRILFGQVREAEGRKVAVVWPMIMPPLDMPRQSLCEGGLVSIFFVSSVFFKEVSCGEKKGVLEGESGRIGGGRYKMRFRILRIWEVEVEKNEVGRKEFRKEGRT